MRSLIQAVTAALLLLAAAFATAQTYPTKPFRPPPYTPSGQQWGEIALTGCRCHEVAHD